MFRTRTIIATLAIALIAVFGLYGPAGGTLPATNPLTVPVDTPGGLMTLETGLTDRVTFDADADGTAESQQTLAQANKCKVSTNETLLGIDGFVGAGSTDVASFASNSIGVAEKTSGTSCYQVGAPSERLVLTLNPVGVSDSLGPMLISSAYLDVELKYSARILATASRAGETVGQFELQSGSSRGTTTPLPGGVVADAIFTCNAASDSGPDAGTSDNCRWPISVPSWLGADDGVSFDKLTLSAVAGSFSLEGGSDGNVPGAPPGSFPQKASLFELAQTADGILNCGAATETEAAEGSEPEVTVRRLDNADPAEACELVPYTLVNGVSTAQLRKPLDRQLSAQFVADVVWTVPIDRPLPLPVTTVDYESADPREGIPVEWCPDPVYDGQTLVGIADPTDRIEHPEIWDEDNVLEGTQYSCIGYQKALVVDGEVRTAEQIYILGDWRLRQ